MTDRAPALHCRCGHFQRQHGTDRRNRPICWGSTTCGCAAYQPETAR